MKCLYIVDKDISIALNLCAKRKNCMCVYTYMYIKVQFLRMTVGLGINKHCKNFWLIDRVHKNDPRRFVWC